MDLGAELLVGEEGVVDGVARLGLRLALLAQQQRRLHGQVPELTLERGKGGRMREIAMIDQLWMDMRALIPLREGEGVHEPEARCV